MKKWAVAFTLLFLSYYAIGQKKVSHRAYPGVRVDVLQSWFINNPNDPNQTGLLKQISLTGIVDIWKESSLSCGISYVHIKSEQFRDPLKLYQFPLILRKYFNPERKGINLAISTQPGWIIKERDGFSIFFGNEMGYQFNIRDFSMNTGLTIQFGGTDDGTPFSNNVHLGIFAHWMIFR